jgi:hypothetical protein
MVFSKKKRKKRKELRLTTVCDTCLVSGCQYNLPCNFVGRELCATAWSLASIVLKRKVLSKAACSMFLSGRSRNAGMEIKSPITIEEVEIDCRTWQHPQSKGSIYTYEQAQELYSV